jgi:hypothetical protein
VYPEAQLRQVETKPVQPELSVQEAVSHGAEYKCLNRPMIRPCKQRRREMRTRNCRWSTETCAHLLIPSTSVGVISVS